MSQFNSVYWVDTPFESWSGESWNWTHSAGCAVASFFYLVPGVIFLIWKSIARKNFLAKKEYAESAQKRFIKHIQCEAVAKVTHLGSHPTLPYNSQLIMGTKGKQLVFYTFDAQLLFETSVEQVQMSAEIRHAQSDSFGTTYIPKGSRVGTITSTETIDFEPDTLKLILPFGNELVTAYFDTRGYDPLALVQWLNRVKLLT